MKKLLLKKTAFSLLIFIGFSSIHLNAQINGTFNNNSGAGDGLWTTLANWTSATIADGTGEATVQENVTLNGSTAIEVGSINLTTNDPRVISGGILQLNGSSSAWTIRSWPSNGTTFDCDVTIAADKKHIEVRGTTNSKLIFASGNTLDLGSNRVDLNNFSSNPIEFNGAVTGTGTFLIEDTQNGNGGILIAAGSNFTNFGGGFITTKNTITSNTTTVFVSSGKSVQVRTLGVLIVNEPNTIEGDIASYKNSTDYGTVYFNANQTQMETLTVDRGDLALDFDASVTSVVFDDYNASPSTGTHGIVNLINYTSGVLKIGTTNTAISQAILDTWLLNGVQPASNTLVQDESGNIIINCTVTDATDLAASAGAEYIALSWTAPMCFDEVLVVAKQGSAVTATPTGDGTTPAYTANANFGSGTDLGTDEYVVYKGSAENIDVSGLTYGGTTYHFKLYSRKDSNWSGGLIVNATTNNTYTSLSGGNADNLNWEDASTWLGGSVPNASSDVIINCGTRINSDVEVNNVTIETRITITEGFSLKANDLAQNSQLIVSSSASAFGSVIVNTLSGDMNDLIYDRWVNDSPDNDLISSPVGGVTFSSVATNSQNENRFFINSEEPTNYFFGPYDNTDGTFKTYFTTTNAATAIVTAKGYRAATIEGAANTVRFSGTVLAAATDIDITDGGDSGTEWNLIGNPYPSYLNFGTFFTANSGEFHLDNVAVYGWNGTDYTVWNGANSSDKLAPGQGFFVRTKDGVTGNVDFTTAMRTTGNTNDFVAKSANTKKALAKINLSNSAKAYSTNIYFIENQTRGLDFGYDSGAFSGTADGIYTNLVEENKGLALAIQSLSYNDLNNVIVPVAINSDAGVELTISLDAASLTIPSDTYVYLKDNLLNTTTLLNDTDYVFTPDAKLSGAGRFFIEFSSKALSTDNIALNEVLIYASQSSKTIIINGVLKTDAVAKVFDIQGRIVLEQKLDNSSVSNIVDANALNTGIYIVQLGNKTQKVMIN